LPKSVCAKVKLRPVSKTVTPHVVLRVYFALLEEPLWDDELARAIDEPLEVFEVAGQPDVVEYRLLELVVESLVRAIDTDARLLLLHGATLGLHPVHVVFVAFHVREKIFDARACANARHKLNPAFDDVEVQDIDGLHDEGCHGNHTSGQIFSFLRCRHPSRRLKRPCEP
jgi:hypothetical protein